MKQTSLTRRGFLTGVAATGAFAALAISGCANNEPETNESSSGSSSDETTNEDSSATVDAITAAFAYSSTSYSPIGNNSALTLAATWHVFESLYDLDLHTYKTYNALAAGDPVQISDIEYEITLREDARFSDGTSVTPTDVVNAFEKNMEDITYRSFLEFIDSVIVKDDTTVTFMLKYPFETLLKGRLSLVKIFPASLTEEDLERTPIGSGPWKYDVIDGTDGGHITFLPNDYYNGSYPAKNEYMDWSILLDAASRAAALIDGSVLAIEDVDNDDIEQLDEAELAVEYVPGFEQPFLMFNTRKEPFNDKRIRQAIYYALDIDKLIANQMEGHASAVTGFLPETYANYHRAATVYTLDTEKAQALLAEAGQTNLSFELMVNNNWVSALVPQIQEDLQAVGITVTINETTLDWAALAESDEVLPYDVILTAGDPSCFGNDPDLLMTWWYGDNVWTQGRSCWKGSEAWEELQVLLQEARESVDTDIQQETWNRCFDIIADEVPLYPLFHCQIATAYNEENLEDFSPISTTGLVFIGATAAETTEES